MRENRRNNWIAVEELRTAGWDSFDRESFGQCAGEFLYCAAFARDCKMVFIKDLGITHILYFSILMLDYKSISY